MGVGCSGTPRAAFTHALCAGVQYATHLATEMYDKWLAIRDVRAAPPTPTTSTTVKLVLDTVEHPDGYRGPVERRHVSLARRLLTRLADCSSASCVRCRFLGVSCGCCVPHCLSPPLHSSAALVAKGKRLLDRIEDHERSGYRPGLWHNGREVAVRLTQNGAHSAGFGAVLLVAHTTAHAVHFSPHHRQPGSRLTICVPKPSGNAGPPSRQPV